MGWMSLQENQLTTTSKKIEKVKLTTISGRLYFSAWFFYGLLSSLTDLEDSQLFVGDI